MKFVTGQEAAVSPSPMAVQTIEGPESSSAIYRHRRLIASIVLVDLVRCAQSLDGGNSAGAGDENGCVQADLICRLFRCMFRRKWKKARAKAKSSSPWWRLGNDPCPEGSAGIQSGDHAAVADHNQGLGGAAGWSSLKIGSGDAANIFVDAILHFAGCSRRSWVIHQVIHIQEHRR